MPISMVASQVAFRVAVSAVRVAAVASTYSFIEFVLTACRLRYDMVQRRSPQFSRQLGIRAEVLPGIHANRRFAIEA